MPQIIKTKTHIILKRIYNKKKNEEIPFWKMNTQATTKKLQKYKPWKVIIYKPSHTYASWNSLGLTTWPKIITWFLIHVLDVQFHMFHLWQWNAFVHSKNKFNWLYVYLCVFISSTFRTIDAFSYFSTYR